MTNVKVVLLGDANVGKTSIKNSFMGLTVKINYIQTIGADFSLKKHKYKAADGKEFDLRYMIYDLAGQPRYDAIRGQYMKGTHAALLVYSISDRTSYEKILSWIGEFKKVIDYDVPMVLIANKIDLREFPEMDLVSTEEGLELAEQIKELYLNKKKNNIYFIETSALNNLKVDEAFDLISKYMYEKYKEDSPY